ncbi:MAG: TonB-dependent receptor [Bacteroidota bacterium]
MRVVKKISFLFIVFLHCSHLLSQENKGTVKGYVYDQLNRPLQFVNISIPDTSIGTVSNSKGYYELNLPPEKDLRINFSYIGYIPQDVVIRLTPGDTRELNINLMEQVTSIDEVSVTQQRFESATLEKIEMKNFKAIPNVSGGFETILKSMGVSSTSELTSQYSVRGGNFDENLVYVNDVEIYRPFLIRSGEQEGLSFINPDLVANVHFSAGGFDAMHGDKMSSVLDIQYKRPTSNQGSVSMSLLGGSVHYEGTDKNNRFTHISGFRYKTNRYLLGTLDTKGDYQPNFADFQTYMTYELSKKLELTFLGNYANNQYNFIPSSRNTNFGTIKDALNIQIYYEGQEVDEFSTIHGSLGLKYTPDSKTILKFFASAFNTNETETFDIEGFYLIKELDNQIGSKTFGDSILNIGVGSYLNHGRNSIDATVISLNHKGSFLTDLYRLRWGLDFQLEFMEDELSEWDYLDSAGYSVPYSDEFVNLFMVRKGSDSFRSNRYSGYVQNTFLFPTLTNEFYFTAGIRASYWDLNDNFTISPRVSMRIVPYQHRNISFRLATGVYHQPPFYKEFRDPEGNLYTNIKAQQSIHYIAGSQINFPMWNRPFVFTTEVYYKSLSNLIPYKVENIRIQYYPQYTAKGYATGVEFKINGEFVEGSESWASMTLLRTREDIKGDFYFNEAGQRINPGYYPRPTDQLFSFNMFFQDYFPTNPDYKVHLNFVYASRRPVSRPNPERLDLTYTISPYKRVDIGFSRAIKKPEDTTSSTSFLRHFKSIWLSGEVFNLLDIRNKISYQWIRTVSNQTGESGYYAVPNYLTSRRINLKLSVRF